jgi:predicted RNA polymerase sigma factor
VTFILKILCGFSTKEVAKSFLTTEDVISKRIYRTKEHFRKHKIRPKIPAKDELESRLAAVASAIYLVFNEGYSSTHSNDLIRNDLIEQTIYLTKALLESDQTNQP